MGTQGSTQYSRLNLSLSLVTARPVMAFYVCIEPCISAGLSPETREQLQNIRGNFKAQITCKQNPRTD